MKYSPFVAPIAVLLVIAFNQTFAESPGSELAIAAPPSQMPVAHITQLTESCHKNWQDMNWKIGEVGDLAKKIRLSITVLRRCARLGQNCSLKVLNFHLSLNPAPKVRFTRWSSARR